MKITIEPTEDQSEFYNAPECLHAKVSVEIPIDGLTSNQMADFMKQAFRAWGFSDFLATEVFGDV